MLRWLLRLLLVGLILAAIGFVVTRLMGQDDEDFDDYDDLDPGFEFQETPVEIDVPADDTTGGAGTADLSAAESTSDGASNSDNGDNGDNGTRLIDISGIGPAYEARLQALGIETVDDLLNADPSSLAEQLGVIGGQSAVEDWLAQARQLSAEGSQGDGANA